MENGAESKYWALAKVGGIWGAVGVTSWSEAASFMAFCLTCWVLGRHIWRDALRPILERCGYIRPLTTAQTLADAIEDAKDGGDGV